MLGSGLLPDETRRFFPVAMLVLAVLWPGCMTACPPFFGARHYRSVMAQTHYGPIAKFALSCGLLEEHEIPVTVDNVHAFSITAQTAKSANAVIYVSNRMTATAEPMRGKSRGANRVSTAASNVEACLPNPMEAGALSTGVWGA